MSGDEHKTTNRAENHARSAIISSTIVTSSLGDSTRFGLLPHAHTQALMFHRASNDT